MSCLKLDHHFRLKSVYSNSLIDKEDDEPFNKILFKKFEARRMDPLMAVGFPLIDAILFRVFKAAYSDQHMQNNDPTANINKTT